MDALLRDEWLPSVTEAVRASDGWDFYHYGNVPRAEGAEPSWRTFDHRPRFNNNYVGLRNRMALISEAYAYAPFEERVAATLRFVEESLAFAHEHAGRIVTLIADADETPIAGRRLVTRAVPRRSPEPAEILLGRTEEVPHPATGAPMRRRLDVAEPTPMDEYVAFEAAEDGVEVAPASYYVPADLASVVDSARRPRRRRGSARDRHDRQRRAVRHPRHLARRTGVRGTPSAHGRRGVDGGGAAPCPPARCSRR